MVGACSQRPLLPSRGKTSSRWPSIPKLGKPCHRPPHAEDAISTWENLLPFLSGKILQSISGAEYMRHKDKGTFVRCAGKQRRKEAINVAVIG